MGGWPSSLILNLYCFRILLLIFGGAHTVIIQVFKDRYFTELSWESRSTEKCNNVSSDKLIVVHSIKTDTCFIAHTDTNCKSALSEKYMPGTYQLSKNQLGSYYLIKSFHICNDKEGGHQLNLDITSYYDTYDQVAPLVLESYRNVCSCVNVPQKYLQNMTKWSIDNHHNSFLAYYEPECSMNRWSPAFIAAGQNINSRNIFRYERNDNKTNTTFKIQSFGPDPQTSYYMINCFNNLFQGLPTQFVTLMTKQKEDFEKLTQRITQLEQQVANFTQKIRADLFNVLS